MKRRPDKRQAAFPIEEIARDRYGNLRHAQPSALADLFAAPSAATNTEEPSP